jgi:hypothetical protein
LVNYQNKGNARELVIKRICYYWPRINEILAIGSLALPFPDLAAPKFKLILFPKKYTLYNQLLNLIFI